MGLFDTIFGNKEGEILELWKKLKRMPEDQLREIFQIKPGAINGQLAFVALFRISPDLALSAIRESDNESYFMSLLNNLYKSDAVLMGEGADLKELRRLLKEIIASQ